MSKPIFEELLAHFDTQAEIARQLGVTRSAVSHWFRRGTVPAEQAIQIEIVTDGKIRAVDLV
jgi:DNA-binding transcriptional regulator YdaS (Cro superfamily)